MSDQTSIKTQSNIDQLLTRNTLYQALAFLFRHPYSQESSFSVRKEGQYWKEAVDKIQLPDKSRLKSFFKMLIEELNKVNFEQWKDQYEGCFGHTANGPVPCYELEYGEEHTYRQPHQLSDIAAFYRAFGLQVNDKVRERVDHVHVECEFMQFLLFKEAYALEHDGEEKAIVCHEASNRFLSEHLGQWAPSFALRLSKYAQSGLMKQIADFAFEFIIQDCQKLGITPGCSDLPVRTIREKLDEGCVSCSLKPEFEH